LPARTGFWNPGISRPGSISAGCNRSSTIKPMVARRFAQDLTPNTFFYAQATVLQILLRSIETAPDWPARLATLLAAHPRIPPDGLGFAAGWEQRTIWR
jgi:hypothetical protein